MATKRIGIEVKATPRNKTGKGKVTKKQTTPISKSQFNSTGKKKVTSTPRNKVVAKNTPSPIGLINEAKKPKPKVSTSTASRLVGGSPTKARKKPY